MLLLRPCSSLSLSTTTTRLSLTRSFSSSCTQLAKKSKRKQDPAANEKAILGRPSNNLKVGIVGMPNIG